MHDPAAKTEVGGHKKGHLALAASARVYLVPAGEEDQLAGFGGPQPAERPPGGEVWHSPLPGVLAALGGHWLVPTVAAGEIGGPCTGLACPAGLAHPPLRLWSPAGLGGAGSWFPDDPRVGRRHWHGTLCGRHERRCHHRQPCGGPHRFGGIFPPLPIALPLFPN